jgi:hypothetical protein
MWAVHSRTSSDEVKSEWSHCFLLPIRLHGVNKEKVTFVYSVVAWILFEYIMMMMTMMIIIIIIIISWLRYCYNNAFVANEINPSYEDFKSNW